MLQTKQSQALSFNTVSGSQRRTQTTLKTTRNNGIKSSLAGSPVAASCLARAEIRTGDPTREGWLQLFGSRLPKSDPMEGPLKNIWSTCCYKRLFAASIDFLPLN